MKKIIQKIKKKKVKMLTKLRKFAPNFKANAIVPKF